MSEETQPYSRRFVADTIRILEQVPTADVERIVDVLADTRARGGRLFFCGSGGGAGHASHAACDFRKLGGYRVLQRHRQRVRADRPHQRRRLGRRVRGVAASVSRCRRRRLPLRVLGRRWRRRAPHQREPGRRHASWPGVGAPASSASSAATAAPAPRSPTPRSSSRRRDRRRHRADRGPAGALWHLIVTHPRLSRQHAEVGIGCAGRTSMRRRHHRRRRLHRLEPRRRRAGRRARRRRHRQLLDGHVQVPRAPRR